MSNVINGYAFSSSLILSEAKDLTPVLASHMVPCVTIGSIVRFLATLGMTEQQRTGVTSLNPAMNR
jgi:hypothetical protein